MARQRPHRDETAVESHTSDVDNGDDDDHLIYTTRRTRSAHELREQAASTTRTTALRVLIGKGVGCRKPKSSQITTAPGQLGAGETETEADEPPNRLPTTRILPASEPLIPPNVLTTLLFEASRLLSVVPASLGAFLNAWCLWHPPGRTATSTSHVRQQNCGMAVEEWGRRAFPDRGDYLLAVLWALLTAHQCLQLTTGLLHRWRAYYPPLSTLIRLLALQAICWPATHFTLDVIGSLGTSPIYDNGDFGILENALLRWTTVRPDVCWAVIGTTTCFSRSIQIWVTSNLLPSSSSSSGISVMVHSALPDRLKPRPKKASIGEDMRKPSGRRWNWVVVGRACILPAGCLYLVMAWIGVWRREVGGC
ncbi:hypothetical protein F5I97DRAFT_1810335 [Phlebopus sp. FC_14]|nr:hypothetical protein F5I97DRAFT_1810335 [Phlebopus sp. FC_14]